MRKSLNAPGSKPRHDGTERVCEVSGFISKKPRVLLGFCVGGGGSTLTVVYLMLLKSLGSVSYRHRVLALKLLNPFRTAVPFWGQSTWSLTGLSPKWDCGSKGVNIDPLQQYVVSSSKVCANCFLWRCLGVNKTEK